MGTVEAACGEDLLKQKQFYALAWPGLGKINSSWVKKDYEVCYYIVSYCLYYYCLLLFLLLYIYISPSISKYTFKDSKADKAREEQSEEEDEEEEKAALQRKVRQLELEIARMKGRKATSPDGM